MSKAKPPSKPTAVGRAHRILQGMTAALKRGRYGETTRLFKEGQACGAIPADDQLSQWLEKTVGKRGTNVLAKAFAQTPCFFCKKGRESCEECDGEGRHGEAMVCDACLSLGTTRCGCCDGSGWVGIDFVPAVFRVPVLTIRTKAAIERLKALLEQPLPEPSRRNCSTNLKKYGGALLVANSLLGVLENMVTAVNQFHELPPNVRMRTDKLVETCVRTATKAERYVRETLDRMATATRLMAESATPESVERSFATNRAERYEMLVGSEDYAGTFLHHPFLHKAMQEAQEHKKAKPAVGDARAKPRKRRRKQSQEKAEHSNDET